MSCLLQINIEFENPKRVPLSEASIIVREALRIILGESGASKLSEVSEAAGVHTFEVKVEKRDLHIIWASLSIYGCHFGQKLAIRIEKVFALE